MEFSYITGNVATDPKRTLSSLTTSQASLWGQHACFSRRDYVDTTDFLSASKGHFLLLNSVCCLPVCSGSVATLPSFYRHESCRPFLVINKIHLLIACFERPYQQL